MNRIYIIFILAFSVIVKADTYKIDPSHTEVGFSVRHLLISNVKGRFTQYSGSFDYDKSTSTLKNLIAEITASSIDTSEKNRDEHLRSDDFFDAEKYKLIKFEGNKAVFSKDGKTAKVYGTLEMKNKKLPVVLDVTIEGEAEVEGTKRIAFIASTEINRKDWGVSWNKTLDNGGVAVSNEVKIRIEGEAKLVKNTNK